jgi:hypothetical protein
MVRLDAVRVMRQGGDRVRASCAELVAVYHLLVKPERPSGRAVVVNGEACMSNAIPAVACLLPSS